MKGRLWGSVEIGQLPLEVCVCLCVSVCGCLFVGG